MTDARAARWSALHHGVDPAAVPLMLPWLQLNWAVATRLRRVPPTAITAVGVLLAGGAAAAATDAPWVALVLVVAAVLCDGLDGAVAVVADRASGTGARADAVADRICDVAFAAVLWRCGAPWWLAVVAAVLAVGVDALRRVRHVPARVTVAERPTFAICAALACGSSAVTSAPWPPTVCAAVWIAAGVTGVAQVTR